MSSSNNSISGIKNFSYKINSYGELKIDISILYYLEDEYKSLSKLPEYNECGLFDLEYKRYFHFINFYRLNEDKYDVFMKIEYSREDGYEDDEEDYYFEIYHFIIRNKINDFFIKKISYQTFFSPIFGLEFSYIEEYFIPYYKNVMYYITEELPLIKKLYKKNLISQLCNKYLNEDMKTSIEEYL